MVLRAILLPAPLFSMDFADCCRCGGLCRAYGRTAAWRWALLPCSAVWFGWFVVRTGLRWTNATRLIYEHPVVITTVLRCCKRPIDLIASAFTSLLLMARPAMSRCLLR